MDRFRKAIDELVDKMKEAIQGEPKSPVEILLDQHLSLDEDLVSFSPKNCTAVAVPTAVLNDFAARTKNIVDYPFIMERVWEILVDHQHDPALMKKALNLLLFLLINGAIQVLKDCQDSPRMAFLESLAQDYNRYEYEQYKFSQHLDIGAGVRKTAAEILHLLTNERELFHARRQAEKLHQKLSDRGLRSSLSSSQLGGSQANDLRPPMYSDYKSSSAMEDIGLKIVTHPDDLFDDAPLSRSASMQLPPRSNLVFGNLDHAQDHDNLLKDRPPTSKRGHSRKDKNTQGHRGHEPQFQVQETRTTATNESVDLLGLESFGFSVDATSPTSSPLPHHTTNTAALSRTQSARQPPIPARFSATI